MLILTASSAHWSNRVNLDLLSERPIPALWKAMMIDFAERGEALLSSLPTIELVSPAEIL